MSTSFFGYPINTHKAQWKNVKSGKVREGEWYYLWSSDKFVVDIKGIRRQFVNGEEPEFGNWKLVEEKKDKL